MWQSAAFLGIGGGGKEMVNLEKSFTAKKVAKKLWKAIIREGEVRLAFEDK